MSLAPIMDFAFLVASAMAYGAGRHLRPRLRWAPTLGFFLVSSLGAWFPLQPGGGLEDRGGRVPAPLAPARAARP
jgi:hypothetical protein